MTKRRERVSHLMRYSDVMQKTLKLTPEQYIELRRAGRIAPNKVFYVLPNFEDEEFGHFEMVAGVPKYDFNPFFNN